MLALRAGERTYSVLSRDKTKGKEGSQQGGGRVDRKEPEKKNTTSQKQVVKCFHCHREGHIRIHCPELKPQEAKPVVLISAARESVKGTRGVKEESAWVVRGRSADSTLSREVDCPQENTSCTSSEKSSGEGSFYHEGVVTVGGCDYPITVMRDTAAQVSVLKNPTGRPLVSKEFVKIKGIVGDTFCPLVVVHLQCPVVSVTAEVAIVDSLPVDGVDFVLGNDLAGGEGISKSDPTSSGGRGVLSCGRGDREPD